MVFARFALVTAAMSMAFSQVELPEGEGKEVTVRVCSACHDMTLTIGERHTEQQWRAVVDDMMRRGAEASDSEKKLILAYLVKNFGK
jgi:cytochrome c5